MHFEHILNIEMRYWNSHKQQIHNSSSNGLVPSHTKNTGTLLPHMHTVSYPVSPESILIGWCQRDVTPVL